MLAIPGLPLDDVQQIFVVLAVLYAVECCWWLRGESRRFFTRPFGRWSDPPPDACGVDAWRLSFANPLPWTESLAAEPFPFPFDGTRLLLPVLDPASGRERYAATEFDALEPVAAVDREVVAGRRRLGAFSSPALAASIAARLERLRAAAAGERGAVAEGVLDELWSVAAARERLEAWRRSSRPVRDLGGWLAVTALVVGPAAYAIRGSMPQAAAVAVAAVAGGLWLATAVAGLLVRGPHPPADPQARLHRLAAFLSPASAMRLCETTGRDLLVAHEPLVVALVTGSGGGAEPVAAAWLRDAVFPAHRPDLPPDDAAAAATLAWWRGACAGRARRAVADAGLDPDAWLAAAPAGPGGRSACPRCGRQFSVAHGECDACGLPLVPTSPR